MGYQCTCAIIAIIEACTHKVTRNICAFILVLTLSGFVHVQFHIDDAIDNIFDDVMIPLYGIQIVT